MLATAVIIGCIVFWIVLIVTIVKLGLICALLVSALFVVFMMVIAVCMVNAEEEKWKGGKNE
ncbi:hypothetical protein IKE99_00620 [Candidatus Saccharibacteria bacterium]|nr:hypothetical protein [Candidatus Saccharibacteria bacterium]